MSNTAIQRQDQPRTLKAILQEPGYLHRFEEILGKRTPQFVSSVLSVGNSLGPNCDPMSIVTSAMTAATLDLPVDKNLGFAWIVPYKGKAQFQMGYKGYIQLGLRTGQYERMNARLVNAEAFQGWDEVGEPIIDWSQIDEAKPTVGYVFAFKLVNGFTKIAYWPRERVEAHAKRYSQSYGGNYDSPWKSNFDQMALKTVIKNELSKWGILSIEMQKAIKLDQAIQEGLDSDPTYLDTPGNGKAAKPADPELITEEQRVALVEAAKKSGAFLTKIIADAGFELMAHITVEKYPDILKIASKKLAAKAKRAATDAETGAAEAAPGSADEQNAAIEQTDVPESAADKAASKRADYILAIMNVESDDPERVAVALDGRVFADLSDGQIKDVYLAVTKK